MRHHQISKQTFKIITQYGDMLVVKQGVQHHQSHQHAHHHPVNSTASGGQQQQGAASEQQQSSVTHQSRPIIMTFHDLGMNSELQFATFCECDEVKLMLQTFTMIHVNFIGQEFDNLGQTAASSLPDDFKYPTVEQMAECIVDICAQLRVRSFVALAVGAGAHIVSTLALIRPDLVHGLFLINPVVSSCSISEWLYFKMSAIASNHQLLGGFNHGPHQQSRLQQQNAGNISLAGSLSSNDDQHRSPERALDDKHHHSRSSPTGLRRLWNAVHHHHHHHPSDSFSSRSSGVSVVSPNPDESDEATTQVNAGDPTKHRAHTPSLSSSIASNQSLAHHKPAASARLRHLILSRNFRLGKHSSHGRHRHHDHEEASCESQARLAGQELDEGEDGEQSAADSGPVSRLLDEADSAHRTKAALNRRSSSVSNPQPASSGRRLSSSSQGSSASGSSKRPPLEYLMYHHFGSVSFQRLRRLSSDAHSQMLEQSGRYATNATKSPATRPTDASAAATAAAAAAVDNDDDDEQKLRNDLTQHRSSCDSATSGQNVRSARLSDQQAALAAATSSLDGSAGSRQIDRSQESLCKSRRRLQRSSSVCLSANYLASISNDRLRANYMQTVYKQYFTQINSHNLWLFAQSFVKRKTLSLRKDCGAAAHAAAAAAALGTSICAAFVGMGPVGAIGGPSASPQVGARATGESALAVSASDRTSGTITSAPVATPQTTTGATSTKTTTTKTSTTGAAKPAPASAKEQQVLVAGTKVKRTFTCQTLIMCSSVHIHRDRALKLMSLLNPLQATWIKTDQLLVLEEKPEKVCRALRLFLQGIGYSMSTYERRLRLCSAQASVSSAESNGSGSGPSLSLEPSSSAPQQQQKPSQQERSGKMST